MKAVITGLIVVILAWIASSFIPTQSEMSDLRENIIELHERNDYQDKTDDRVERKVDAIYKLLLDWRQSC